MNHKRKQEIGDLCESNRRPKPLLRQIRCHAAGRQEGVSPLKRNKRSAEIEIAIRLQMLKIIAGTPRMAHTPDSLPLKKEGQSWLIRHTCHDEAQLAEIVDLAGLSLLIRYHSGQRDRVRRLEIAPCYGLDGGRFQLVAHFKSGFCDCIVTDLIALVDSQ